jgi:hypothetical protein
MNTLTNAWTSLVGFLDQHPELRPNLVKAAALAAGFVVALGVADDRSGKKVKRAAKKLVRNATKTAKSAGKLAKGVRKLALKHPQRVAALLASAATLGVHPDEARDPKGGGEGDLESVRH